MDDADMAEAKEEFQAPGRIRASRKPEGPEPKGRCEYCDEITNDTVRWCDHDCRDDWQREQMFLTHGGFK